MLNQFRYGLSKAHEVFDYDKLAKFYALNTVGCTFHGFRWHNLRFYYNPVIGKLEPIGYDSHGSGPIVKEQAEIISFYRPEFCGETATKEQKNYMLEAILNDTVFVKKMLFYLNRYSNSTYITSSLSRLQPAIAKYEDLLHREFVDYKYDWEIRLNIRNLNKKLTNLLVI